MAKEFKAVALIERITHLINALVRNRIGFSLAFYAAISSILGVGWVILPAVGAISVTLTEWIFYGFMIVCAVVVLHLLALLYIDRQCTADSAIGAREVLVMRAKRFYIAGLIIGFYVVFSFSKSL